MPISVEPKILNIGIPCFRAHSKSATSRLKPPEPALSIFLREARRDASLRASLNNADRAGGNMHTHVKPCSSSIVRTSGTGAGRVLGMMMHEPSFAAIQLRADPARWQKL